jgi:hypothetical protein
MTERGSFDLGSACQGVGGDLNDGTIILIFGAWGKRLHLVHIILFASFTYTWEKKVEQQKKDEFSSVNKIQF